MELLLSEPWRRPVQELGYLKRKPLEDCSTNKFQPVAINEFHSFPNELDPASARTPLSGHRSVAVAHSLTRFSRRCFLNNLELHCDVDTRTPSHALTLTETHN